MKRTGILLSLSALTACTAQGENLRLTSGVMISNVTVVSVQPATVTLRKEGKTRTLPVHDFTTVSAAKLPLTNSPYATIVELTKALGEAGDSVSEIANMTDELQKQFEKGRKASAELIAVLIKRQDILFQALLDLGDNIDDYISAEKEAGRISEKQADRINDLLAQAAEKAKNLPALPTVPKTETKGTP